MNLINCKSSNSGKEVFGKNPKGCIESYKSKEYQYAQAGHLLSPWVAIDFVNASLNSVQPAGFRSVITVSNHSSPMTDPPHCAVIKSFSFGHSDGLDVRVVIHDTHSGAFEEFMRHLLTDWKCTIVKSATVHMRFQFGWVKSGCKEPIPESRSPCYYAVCQSVDQNFSEGKIIFEITGKDMGHVMPEGSAEWERGGQGDKGVFFIHAMNEFLTDPNSPGPNLSEIRFELRDNAQQTFNSNNTSGGLKLFRFQTEQEQKLGRKGVWRASGQNKLETIRKWLDENPSINGNPWTIKIDSVNNQGRLLIQEVLIDSSCGDRSDEFFDSNSLGTFIVNGGPMSPVIEFNPKVKWNWALLTGGGAGNAGDLEVNPSGREGAKHTGSICLPKDASNDGAGQATNAITPENVSNSGSDGAKAHMEHQALTKTTIPISINAIDAELVIVGDPTFCPPRYAMRRFISIVIINPFHILTEGGGPCGDWFLAQPPCNSVMSNKGWMITGVSHQIDLGKYTTNISVKLLAPGSDFGKGSSLGGWSKGWKPQVC